MALRLPKFVSLSTARARATRQECCLACCPCGGSCSGLERKAPCSVEIILLSLVQSCLPDDVVHAIHKRPARANIAKRTTSLSPKHAAEVNVQMNKNLARLKSFSRRPLSRHAPTLRRLERDVVSAELCPVEIVAPRRDSFTQTTSSSHSSVMAVVSAFTSN